MKIAFRKSYHGRGSGKKRIGRKLKLLLAYMMARLGLDHNQFAVSLPGGSSPVLLDWTEPVETLLASIPALPRRKKAEKKKSVITSYTTRFISFFMEKSFSTENFVLEKNNKTRNISF